MDGSFTLGSEAHPGKGCGCSGPCDCLPAEFTRLRYAYGQRLGAVELSDEQSYLVGKDRFHNARCHGAGVLCGLTADRFVWPQGATGNPPSTVLRVTRGAALDECGREVLVPCDQCIDVATWFALNVATLSPAPTSSAPLPLWVALRYRECPSDPGPVPRDPCGCGPGGCDYTRVRESFELCLFAGKPPACAGATFPSAAQLLAALNGAGVDPNALQAQLDTLTGQPCVAAPADEWICLAAFSATITGAGPSQTVSDITAPDNTIAGRRPLLSTSALQALVVGVANATGAAGLLEAGPTISGIGFTGAGATAGTLSINIDLITDPKPLPGPTQIAAGTLLPSEIQVQALDTNNWQWTPVTLGAPTITPSGIDATMSGVGAGAYRVSLISPDATPIVDERMRPLSPSRFAQNFGLALDATNTLELVTVPL